MWSCRLDEFKKFREFCKIIAANGEFILPGTMSVPIHYRGQVIAALGLTYKPTQDPELAVAELHQAAGQLNALL